MHTTRGFSLIEAVVALVILEVAILATVAALLQVELLRRRAAGGAAADAARWQAWHNALSAPSCRGAAAPAAVPLTLPSTAFRPALPATLSCGR
jgi:Tfp pilus assembly protein PilV